MDKEDVEHTHTQILLSHKKNEISHCATTQMDWEGVTLNEINLAEKDKYSVLSLI